MSRRVEGRSILITGAGSGMGRVIALALADEGANVTLLDLNLEAANPFKVEIVAVAVSGNVVKRAAVVMAVETSVESIGRLDCMFAIAGIIKPTHFHETTEENFRSALVVNSLG
jgi:meso-butanediol dehydrogenase/(S,S)-butanediol dehydrogenase/diacetyl reductase